MRVKISYLINAIFAMIIIYFNTTNAVAETNSISIVLAGDSIVSLPLSDVHDEPFIELINEIRASDVAVVNLETLIHKYKGFPQAQSGGTWMASEPKIARELAWAGIDMVALSNNHTFDYGAIGVIENIENLRNAGIKYAGAGLNLQDARQPAFFFTGNTKVALLSTASTFVSFGIAGRSRPNSDGRPGLNPLTVKRKRLYHKLFWSKWASYAGVEFYEVNQEDWKENLDAVQKAKSESDIVIMSVHAHQKAPGSIYAVPKFLQRFAHHCIENGADIFFAHGPHIPRGIEIFNGKPIFYSLGNFVLQQEMMENQPAEFYSKHGLGNEATIEDVYSPGPVKPGPEWESFVAKILFVENQMKRIDLIPISLGVHKPKGDRGRPFVAKSGQAKKIIEQLAEISMPFGTMIEFDGSYGAVRTN